MSSLPCAGEDPGGDGVRAVEIPEELLSGVESEDAMTEAKTAKSDLKIPTFATEAEEAKWWFENEELIAD